MSEENLTQVLEKVTSRSQFHGVLLQTVRNPTLLDQYSSVEKPMISPESVAFKRHSQESAFSESHVQYF